MSWLDTLIFGYKTIYGGPTAAPVEAPQRAKVHFKNAAVTDDIANARTVVELTDVVVPFVFQLSGEYSGAIVPGFFDPPRLVEGARTIVSVSLVRRTAGTAGTTRCDVLKNGVSIFVNAAAMPQVDAASGNDATDTVAIFVDDALADQDIVEVSLEEVETFLAGPPPGPEGFTVTIRFSG